MSWSVKIIAKKSDADALLSHYFRYEPEVGEFLKSQVARIPNAVPPNPSWDSGTHVLIEGCGHAGAINNLRIEPFNLMVPLPPASAILAGTCVGVEGNASPAPITATTPPLFETTTATPPTTTTTTTATPPTT